MHNETNDYAGRVKNLVVVALSVLVIVTLVYTLINYLVNLFSLIKLLTSLIVNMLINTLTKCVTNHFVNARASFTHGAILNILNDFINRFLFNLINVRTAKDFDSFIVSVLNTYIYV